MLVANHAQDATRRMIKAADCDGKRFIVRADELLITFLELESAIGKASESTAAAG